MMGPTRHCVLPPTTPFFTALSDPAALVPLSRFPSPPPSRYANLSNPNPAPFSLFFHSRVRHVKAIVEDDHDMADLISENDEFGWCVFFAPVAFLLSPTEQTDRQGMNVPFPAHPHRRPWHATHVAPIHHQQSCVHSHRSYFAPLLPIFYPESIRSVLSLGDLDGDGAPEIAVAAETSPAQENQPSIHMIFLQPQADNNAAATATKKRNMKEERKDRGAMQDRMGERAGERRRE